MLPESLNLAMFQGAAFGPEVIYLQDSSGNALNVTGWTPIAHAAEAPGCGREFDLAPSISNGSNGEVTISHSNGNTANFAAGRYVWDLFMRASNGVTYGPYRSGRVAVSPTASQPETV
jgi:hypothetical protein